MLTPLPLGRWRNMWKPPNRYLQSNLLIVWSWEFRMTPARRMPNAHMSDTTSISLGISMLQWMLWMNVQQCTSYNHTYKLGQNFCANMYYVCILRYLYYLICWNCSISLLKKQVNIFDSQYILTYLYITQSVYDKCDSSDE